MHVFALGKYCFLSNAGLKATLGEYMSWEMLRILGEKNNTYGEPEAK